MIFEGEEMSFKEIADEKKARNASWWHYEELRLHFHRTIKMKHVWKVYEEMSKEGIYKFSFAVVKIHHENDRRYYHNYSLPAQIPVQFRDLPFFPPQGDVYEHMTHMDDIIEIHHAKSGHLVDGILLKRETFKSHIKERVRKNNPKYVIQFYVKDDVDVESYVKTLSLITEIIKEIRDEYAVEKYGKKGALLIEQRKEVHKKYPIAILQVTEEMEAKYE